MTPVEIIQRAMKMDLCTEDGELVDLDVRPGLSSSEIDIFEKTLPSPVPASVRELLSFTSGFYGGDIDVRFTGDPDAFDYGDLFPHGLPIVMDGFGNSWLVDLNSGSKEWAPVYFACHDPPVIQFQADSLEKFLSDLFQAYEPPFDSDTRRVRDEGMTIWKQNPDVISFENAIQANEPLLSVFAKELGPKWEFIDLRKAKPGDGFSWGRYGPNTEVRRSGTERIFAYRKG
jgi:hypothetical protein